jgi:nitrate reductase gamma subunit
MFPILGIIAAGVASALTAGEAVVIGASVGAATVIGTNALTKKKREVSDENSDTGIDDEEIKAAVIMALKIIRESKAK